MKPVLKNVNIFRRFIIFLSFCAVIFSVINYRTAQAGFTETKKVPEFKGSAQEVTLFILIVLFSFAFITFLLPRSLSALSITSSALAFRYPFFAIAEGNIPKYNPALALLFGAILLAGALVNFFGYVCDSDLRPSWKLKRCVIPAFCLCAFAALLQLIKLKMSVDEEQLPLFFSAYNVIVISAAVPAVTATVLCLYGKGKDKYLGTRHLVASALATVIPAALLSVNLISG